MWSAISKNLSSNQCTCYFEKVEVSQRILYPREKALHEARYSGERGGIVLSRPHPTESLIRGYEYMKYNEHKLTFFCYLLRKHTVNERRCLMQIKFESVDEFLLLVLRHFYQTLAIRKVLST